MGSTSGHQKNSEATDSRSLMENFVFLHYLATTDKENRTYPILTALDALNELGKSFDAVKGGRQTLLIQNNSAKN